ncbi:hypothetical protein NW754_010920 [Fusarium falciforme]|nr:hypothetical protein NW754_010920 [Fusarium falciforme]
MSGMEPLAALGLACNIMQLLSFGGEAISLCRKVYKTGEIDLVDPTKLKSEILAESKGLLATTLQQVASGQQDRSHQMVKALEGAQDRFNSEYLRNQRTIEQQIAATTRDLQHERTRVQQEKRENEQRRDWDHLLKSLHFDARTERANMIRQEYSGTCRWVFEVCPESHPQTRPCFTTWLQSKGQPIYWICGKPGSGKSTLMKSITSDESPTRDSLEQWQPDVQILSHYFWLAGSAMQNNIKGFLCSLVYQVLSRDMPSALALLESNPDIKQKSCVTDWDPTELRRILINLTHQAGKAFCLFIDGLNEVSPEESPRDLIDIITELQSPQIPRAWN